MNIEIELDIVIGIFCLLATFVWIFYAIKPAAAPSFVQRLSYLTVAAIVFITALETLGVTL